MRLRNLKNKEELLENCSYLINNPEKYQGLWNEEVFKNNHPIYIEIGMGKGSFIKNMALTFPNINFIGIEKFDGVVARAINNVNENIPSNLRIIKTDAINLKDIFDHEIETIYLNFSDPWPKKRQEKRRLTSKIYLDSYESLFKGDKVIIQKTDNTDLYAYSLVSLNDFGYKIVEASLDLHKTDIFNIKTEYETKFSQKGVKINYLKAIKK